MPVPGACRRAALFVGGEGRWPAAGGYSRGSAIRGGLLSDNSGRKETRRRPKCGSRTPIPSSSPRHGQVGPTPASIGGGAAWAHPLAIRGGPPTIDCKSPPLLVNPCGQLPLSTRKYKGRINENPIQRENFPSICSCCDEEDRPKVVVESLRVKSQRHDVILK